MTGTYYNVSDWMAY